MNCNQCGDEVYTTPSQYTKFCKDCGKIVLKLETTNKPITPIPLVNQSVSTQPTYNQPSNFNQQQNSAYTPNAPVYEPATKNNTNTILIVSLIVGLMVIGGIVYYVQTKNNPNLNGTALAETDEATVAVEEVQQIPTATQPATTTNNSSTTYTNQTTTSTNFTDDYFTSKINNYYQTESNRNFDALYNGYLFSATYYYDINQPTYENLKERFEHLWSITSDVSNNIKSYTVNRYDTYTEVIVLLDFSYFAIKSQTNNTKTDINVLFNFDKSGNITSIYERK